MPRQLFVALLFFSPRLLSFFSKALPHTWKLEALTVAGVNQPSAALRNINKLQGREESRASPLLSNALIQTEAKEGKARQGNLQSPSSPICCHLALFLWHSSLYILRAPRAPHAVQGADEGC